MSSQFVCPLCGHEIYGKTTQDINVSVTPLLQQHPMVLVLVLTDVLVVPYPLPLGFGDAFYLYYRVVVECDSFLAYLRSVSQGLCCWMDFSFVAPGTHDQMVCFKNCWPSRSMAGQKKWEGKGGSVESGNPARRAGSSRATRTRAGD